MASLLARTVHLIVSAATLLSGSLDVCLTPLDPSCEAGVAAVDAWARTLTADDPTLVLPFIDRSSPFVQMHPLGWSVNRLVLEHIMGWRVYSSSPALLTQHKDDLDISSRDLSDLQSKDLPLVLSNVAIPPSNSWAPYTLPVFFDNETGLAVLTIYNSNQPLNHPQIESTLGILDYVARVNARSGCGGEPSLLDNYVNRSATETQCWLPVIVYADIRTNFVDWLYPVVNHDHPPALIVSVEESVEELGRLSRVGSNGVWVVTYEMKNDVYAQMSISIEEGGQSISNVTLIERDMKVLPDEIKDSTYTTRQQALQNLASEAADADPVVGQSLAVPAQRSGTYRRCKAGECEVGNLFNDALRWYKATDIAFQNSGGFRGPGWPAGDVRVSDVWSALPFDNTPCTGVISGISLFRLLNYSLTWSTFEGENTEFGDRLLQVSGLRVSYNLGLPNTTRMVALEYWDKESQGYMPVKRLGLYSFATISFMCSGFVEYPLLLGSESLKLPGEVPGEIDDGIIIQSIVTDYLFQLDEPYDPGKPEERLVNRTDIMEPLDFIQTAGSCVPGEFWQQETFTCAPCPSQVSITFLSSQLSFDDESGDQSIQLVNAALYDVAVLVKSLPAWASITSISLNSDQEASFQNGPVEIQSGETLNITFTVDLESLEPGTAQGAVAIGVLDGGQYPGCSGRDAVFDILARKYPEEDLNHLGPILYVGWGLAGVTIVTAVILTLWVVKYRHTQTVRTLQPIFLVMISLGVLVMALSLIPLGIDDGFASQRWCDISCMSIPWLLSLGFTAAMSALFSKLWRIHRLFKATPFRRIQIKAKDVMAPFITLFTLNFAVLLIWTLISPLRFHRLQIDDEPYNTYGTCQSNNESFGTAMSSIVISVNAVSLLFASYTAYLARDISDEFAESKSVGLALFCWVQLFCVAGPMLFLIDSDNVAAKYFLQSGVIFAVCMSMLAFIFGPIVWQKNHATATMTAQRGRERSAAETNGSNGVASSAKYSLKDRGIHVSGLDQLRARGSAVSQQSSSKASPDVHDLFDVPDVEEEYVDHRASASPEAPVHRASQSTPSKLRHSLETVSESRGNSKAVKIPPLTQVVHEEDDQVVTKIRERLQQRLDQRGQGGDKSRYSEETEIITVSSSQSGDKGGTTEPATGKKSGGNEVSGMLFM